MLLRVVPLLAVMVMLLSLLLAHTWPPDHKDGLFAPAHQVSGLF